jgi:D-alanine transaminase
MSDQVVYWCGAFVPKANVRVSPDDRAFLFGDGVYDVIRAIDGRLFRGADHIDRFSRGAAALDIDAGGLDVAAVAHELLARNGLEHGQATVYMQLTRGAAPRTHAFPRPAAPPSVYLAAQAFTPRRSSLDEGIRVITVPDVRWGRCDIKSICLLPNVLAAEQAMQAGAEEALFVRDGVVLEGAHTSFCAVLADVLVTAPLSNQILPGITRRVVLELAQRLGLPVREGPILRAELSRATEAFVTGTTTDVTPVISVDGQSVGSGTPGPVTRRIQEGLAEAFTELTP